MSTSSTSERVAAADTGLHARIAFENVSLRFKQHWAERQLRQIVLDAVRWRPSPAPPSRWLYRNLSFSIDHGERVGIVGGNGAGKSMLLRTIVGVYLPTQGRVVVRGRVSALIDLGSGFNQELSGVENIVLSGVLQGFTPDEMRAKAQRILEFAGLAHAGDTPTKYYSSGMLLRLVFSIATDIDPEILLLDEIFGAGDAEFAQRGLQRMVELLDSSHIAVIVSHNLDLVREFCTRAIWIRNGSIAMDGAPADVCQEYTKAATERG
ncbi:MAG: ABC transporter ATP-binding protein [Acidimicrobiia bacterium]|nr:ABC transporter ATP-binding protein [Acidimicrobiia bacterium]